MVKNDGLLSPAQIAQKRKNKVTLVVSIILSLVIIGAISVWLILNPVPVSAPEAKDLNSNVSLEENLKVPGLTWNVQSADFTDTPTGAWVLDQSNGQLSNEAYPGCFMFWSQAGTGVDDGLNDSDNTKDFIDGLGGNESDNLWVNVDGEKGELEFASTKLVDDEGFFTMALVRYVSVEGVILIGKFSCEEESALSDLTDGKSVSDFGIKLVKN